MITGQVNEKQLTYRQKAGLNFSSIKTFDQDGVGIFYKEYILGERDDKTSAALVIGSLVDDMVLTYKGNENDFYQNFDDKYAKFDGVRSSAQAFDLADALFDSMMETRTTNGTFTGDFEYCFKEAFDKVQAAGKYKGKTWEQGLVDFNKVARSYYDTKISSVGKIVVDLKLLKIAENVTKVLLSDEFTAGLFKGEDKAIAEKVVIEFEYCGIKCKCEIDFVLFDHKAKTIQVGDLKTTFDNESFDYMYLKSGYYLQGSFYTIALTEWAKEEFPEYEVIPPIFVVADTSKNNRRPLKYQLSDEDFENGVEGFKANGRSYKGLYELVEEIKWHMESDIWNCSKEAIINSGNLKLSINYDK